VGTCGKPWNWYHEVLLDIVGGASGEQNAESMEPISPQLSFVGDQLSLLQRLV